MGKVRFRSRGRPGAFRGAPCASQAVTAQTHLAFVLARSIMTTPSECRGTSSSTRCTRRYPASTGRVISCAVGQPFFAQTSPLPRARRTPACHTNACRRGFATTCPPYACRTPHIFLAFPRLIPTNSTSVASHLMSLPSMEARIRAAKTVDRRAESGGGGWGGKNGPMNRSSGGQKRG